MIKLFIKILIIFLFTINQSLTEENMMILKLKDGDVKIELFSDTAPNHVKRIKELADAGKYDNVVFHRVIDGFMAQTGDVKFGNSNSDDFDLRRAGMGGSDLPDLKQEFSNLPHDRGTLSMADHQILIVLIVNFLYVLNQHHFLIINILFLEKLSKEWNLLIRSKEVMKIIMVQ